MTGNGLFSMAGIRVSALTTQMRRHSPTARSDLCQSRGTGRTPSGDWHRRAVQRRAQQEGFSMRTHHMIRGAGPGAVRPGMPAPSAQPTRHRRLRPHPTVGANPTLPEPEKKAIPVVQIAEAKGWPAGHEADGAGRCPGQCLRQRPRASALAVHLAERRRAGGRDRRAAAPGRWQGHQGRGHEEDA